MHRMTAVVVLVVMLGGCLLENRPGEDGDPEASAELRRAVVVGLDITASFAHSFAAAKAAIALEVGRALPGDTWHFCTIRRRSHSDRAMIPGLECVRFPEVGAISNPFNRRERQARDEALAEHEQRRHEVIETLEKYRPEFVRGTDIHGMLSKAGSLLAGYPDRRKILILATNFGETENLEVAPELQDVQAYVLLQRGPDPGEVTARQEKWEGQLRSYGAVTVEFVDRANWSLPIIAQGGDGR